MRTHPFWTPPPLPPSLPFCPQSNWLIDFIQWVGDNNASDITSTGGCSNPYVGATSGPLTNYDPPQQLAGCVSAASFYALFNQVSGDSMGAGPTVLFLRLSSVFVAF